MTTYHHSAVHSRLLPRSLSLGIAMALAGVAIPPAHAVQFGDPVGWHGTVNTTLSYGVSVRTSDPSSQEIAKAYYDAHHDDFAVACVW